MVIKELSIFESAQAQLDEVADIINLDPGIHATLREPMKELHVSIPVAMDNGEGIIQTKQLMLLELWLCG